MFQLGQPIPLQVGYANGLSFVAAILYNVTTGSPVVTGSPIALTGVTGSINYYGEVTPPSIGAYSVGYAVFTDGTYTTQDTNYTEDSEGFQVINLSTYSQGVPIQSLAAVISGVPTLTAILMEQ